MPLFGLLRVRALRGVEVWREEVCCHREGAASTGARNIGGNTWQCDEAGMSVAQRIALTLLVVDDIGK